MNRIKRLSCYFSKLELALWISSVSLILISFMLFDRVNYITLIASLIGATSLIFNAKGNPLGQLLIIVFSILYGIISFTFSYYGEMITYLGMTAPMALFALISWLRNPFKGNRAEVTVNSLKVGEIIFMLILSAGVTVIFYFILDIFNTANIIPSTISVTTSFMAVYLTFRRSPYFALAYAANDLVLIVLWTLAAMTNRTYLSVTVCFAMFLINDLYGFINWRKIRKRQLENERNKLIKRDNRCNSCKSLPCPKGRGTNR
ncbi:MAG: nicotinamide riboside transporter PnuC [Acutalibacteraceae bacterium]